MGSMWPFSFFLCMGPLVLLGLVAVSIRTLWITLVPPSKMPREAACGSCGYAVAGLNQPTCPECGSDWRAAGITTPALIMRYRGGLFGAIISWTVLLGSIGVLVLGLGTALVGRQYVSTVSTTPSTWTTPLTPNSGAYANIDFSSTGAMGGPGSPDISVDLALLGGAVWKMSVDPTKSCQITDPANPGAPIVSPYGPGSVAALFTASGLDTTKPTVAAEVAELQKIIDLQIMSPYTQPGQMNLNAFTAGRMRFSGGRAATTIAGPAAWAGILFLAGSVVWLLIYILGIIYIVTRRRRILGRYSSQTVYSPGM